MKKAKRENMREENVRYFEYLRGIGLFKQTGLRGKPFMPATSRIRIRRLWVYAIVRRRTLMKEEGKEVSIDKKCKNKRKGKIERS